MENFKENSFYSTQNKQLRAERSLLYRLRVKTWEFLKASARDLVPSKQPPIKEIGATHRGLKTKMLEKGKTKFWKMIGISFFVVVSHQVVRLAR